MVSISLAVASLINQRVNQFLAVHAFLPVVIKIAEKCIVMYLDKSDKDCTSYGTITQAK